MKKIYTLLLASVFSGGVFAQVQNADAIKIQREPQTVSADVFNRHTGDNTRNGLEQFWLHYGSAVNGLYTSTPGVWNSYLFPDSVPRVTGSSYGPSIHMLGDVLDVNSFVWTGATPAYAPMNTAPGNPSTSWSRGQSFYVDSIEVGYRYHRHHPSGNAITDTLIAYVYEGSMPGPGTTNVGYVLPPWAQNFGGSTTDSIFYKVIGFDFPTNKPSAVAATVIKIPLTAADTTPSTNLRFLTFAVNGTTGLLINAKKLVVCAVQFKPGYTYNASSNLNTNINEFRTISYEEKGVNTFPVLDPCQYPHHLDCDWNVSSVVTRTTRYNTSTNGWNGQFTPTWAFGQGWELEHHFISYKVRALNVSVKENNTNNILLAQNTPNPFNGSTVIGYELLKASDVALSVYDITGKKVLDQKEGKQTSGKHALTLNATTLSAGIYYYTLKAGESSLTKKMVIVE